MSQFVKVFKALSDENRIMIVNYLKDGELCACKILEKMNISQSTLSHHMKILKECELVLSNKVGIWTHYSLNVAVIEIIETYFQQLKNIKKGLPCHCTKMDKEA